MDKWDKTLFNILESANQEWDNLCQNLSQAMDEVINDVTETTEEILETLDTVNENLVILFLDDIEAILSSIEQLLEESNLENINFNENEFEFDEILNDSDFIITEYDFNAHFETNPKINPLLEKHKVCQGCRNFHGRFYGKNLLICAIHPYGCEYEKCPDWEAFEQPNK